MLQIFIDFKIIQIKDDTKLVDQSLTYRDITKIYYVKTERKFLGSFMTFEILSSELKPTHSAFFSFCIN